MKFCNETSARILQVVVQTAQIQLSATRRQIIVQKKGSNGNKQYRIFALDIDQFFHRVAMVHALFVKLRLNKLFFALFLFYGPLQFLLASCCLLLFYHFITVFRISVNLPRFVFPTKFLELLAAQFTSPLICFGGLVILIQTLCHNPATIWRDITFKEVYKL